MEHLNQPEEADLEGAEAVVSAATNGISRRHVMGGAVGLAVA